jgi:hypothetical protein
MNPTQDIICLLKAGCGQSYSAFQKEGYFQIKYPQDIQTLKNKNLQIM